MFQFIFSVLQYLVQKFDVLIQRQQKVSFLKHQFYLNFICKQKKQDSNSEKRLDYIEWEDYFMALALLSAMRSKDPNRQVGACIADSENRIVGIGYNGFPRGCSDDVLPWGKSEKWLHTKYPYVCHAEMNAIMNKNSTKLNGCRMFVTLFPCNDCAKLIIQSGISEVIYQGEIPDNEQSSASRRMFELSKIKITKRIQTIQMTQCDLCGL